MPRPLRYAVYAGVLGLVLHLLGVLPWFHGTPP